MRRRAGGWAGGWVFLAGVRLKPDLWVSAEGWAGGWVFLAGVRLKPDLRFSESWALLHIFGGRQAKA
jgi:hypothetical protein